MGIGHWEILLIGLVCFLVFVPVIAVALAAVAILKRSANSGAANPNLSPCPDCQQLVSRQATSCPQCGRPFGQKPD